jgi:ribosomal protein L5
MREPHLLINQVPRIEKIVINRGLGDASQNAKILNHR